jgi:hypothetical protein
VGSSFPQSSHWSNVLECSASYLNLPSTLHNLPEPKHLQQEEAMQEEPSTFFLDNICSK